MRSYERAAIFFRASRPLLAISTSYPSSPRMSAMAAATSGSSSTTRMQARRRASIVDNCSAGIRVSLTRKETQAPGHFATIEKPATYRVAPQSGSRKSSVMAFHGHPMGHRRLLRRDAEVVLADDVVAVEHAPGDVPRDGHAYSLGDTRAHHRPGNVAGLLLARQREQKTRSRRSNPLG